MSELLENTLLTSSGLLEAGDTFAKLWYTRPPSTAAAVFSANSTFKLSPSMIQTYLTCPRQYFYQYLLQLQEGTRQLDQAFGILVHCILEKFNTRYGAQGTRETFQVFF